MKQAGRIKVRVFWLRRIDDSNRDLNRVNHRSESLLRIKIKHSRLTLWDTISSGS